MHCTAKALKWRIAWVTRFGVVCVCHLSCAGDVYEGHFRRGCRDGYGVYSWASGDVLAGWWSAGRPHGLVTVVVAADAITFRGRFHHGSCCGVAVVRRENGPWCDCKRRARDELNWGAVVLLTRVVCVMLPFSAGLRVHGVATSRSRSQMPRCQAVCAIESLPQT